MMQKKKVALVFPPEWFSTAGPYLSLPSLTAYLRCHGVSVSPVDLNIEARNYLLSPKELQKSDQLLQARVQGYKKSYPHVVEAFLPVLLQAPSLIDSIEAAKAVWKCDGFYDVEKYLWARNQLELGWDFYKAAHSFEPGPENKGSVFSNCEQLIREVCNQEHNVFLDFYREYGLERVLVGNPEIVGISIVDIPQVIPGLTLARLIKQSRPEIHVVIGGNVLTRWKEVLPQHPELFQFFDSVIVHEGEQALLQLTERLSSGEDLSQVPNLIYQDAGAVKLSERFVVEDLDQLPTLDFEGLPLDLYMAPDLVLPMYASRGCYWDRCAFCAHGYGYPRGYRLRAAEKVSEDLEILSKKYDARQFFFADEVLSPAGFQAVSDAILKRGLTITWNANARFENAFDPDLLGKIFEAGCEMIFWGLEAGADRVLRLMDKGIEIETVKRVAGESRNVGIWNHAFVFFGFPGETEIEARGTMDFVLNHQGSIQTAGGGPFSLYRHSRVMRQPEAFGVTVHHGGDLLLQFGYETQQGMSEGEISDLWLDLYRRHITECGDYGIWGALPSEHMFLYKTRLSDKGMLEQSSALKKAIREHLNENTIY